ncbi:MAG: S8 family serine peptidase [Bacteroidetes bacterium]|nr:S8 family serine peptidase [Bacteroidota bacterium]HET6244793.1 S8 family serine peptidase [Bacteroidia bacterium]
MRVNRFFLLLPLLFFFLINTVAIGQNYGKYWIFFKDKSSVGFNPLEYFDTKAIERREAAGLPMSDNTDWPVNENYIASVEALADSVGKSTRWFNAVVCYAKTSQLESIKKLPFVTEIIPFSTSSASLAFIENPKQDKAEEMYKKLSREDQHLLASQTASMGIKQFEEQNIDGRGIRIAIFDAGFPGVNTHPAFDHIRKSGRIIKTWDFVQNKEHVYGYNPHGTMVMSCIGGIIDSIKIGLATGAEFILARTERAKFEPFSEEENWLAAAEWADKNGAHIINSSLGYTHHRYFKEQMDGSYSLVSRAANMAASKGILVVNAAGNEGGKSWKTIGTPADADSVLAVGGIDPDKFYHITFSSYGPNARKKMKPNVSAFGKVIAAGKANLSLANGTSFASPLIAGFAACAWQKNPKLNNMEIFKEIEKSGDLYPYYDYVHGFGIPRANYFTQENSPNIVPTFHVFVDNSFVKITIKEEYLPKKDLNSTLNELVSNETLNYEAQRIFYLYYHIENSQGFLNKYFIVNVKQAEVLSLPVSDFKPGQTVRFHYKGYTEEFKF